MIRYQDNCKNIIVLVYVHVIVAILISYTRSHNFCEVYANNYVIQATAMNNINGVSTAVCCLNMGSTHIQSMGLEQGIQD